MSKRDQVLTAATRGALDRVVLRGARRTGVQLPLGFVTNPDAPPPAAALVHGGGDAALRLYLTLWVMATRAPYTITQRIAARNWAVTLGLTDPQHAGARTIARALRRIERAHLLELPTQGGGQPPTIQLLDPAGTGKPAPPIRGRYLRVGLGLWQRGLIVTLPTPALAIYLALLDITGGHEQTPWWAPGERKQSYGLSEGTWTRGVADLRARHFLTTGSAPVSNDFDYTRTRQTYLLHRSELDDPVAAPETDPS